MPNKKRQVVLGRYGWSRKKKAFRIKFRVVRKLFYFLIPVVILGGIFYFLFISDRREVKEENISRIKAVSEEEREAIGIWCKGSDCFYFDKEGVIFEESPKSSGSLLISIEDARGTAANLGSAVLSESQIASAQDAQRLVKGNFPFAVSSILVRTGEEYELLTTEGWRVLLNKTDGLEYQLSNLKYVIDEEIKTRRGELEYVDLRLGNRVFYKYKGAKK